MEIWKDIAGYEGKYQVSNYGQVKSLNYNRTGREQLLKQHSVSTGYCQVNLWKNGEHKMHYVHRLVAEAFVSGYEEGLVVNHIDESKTNNHHSNLEWVTQRQNTMISSNNPFRGKAVRCIELDTIYDSTIEAARQTGCDQSHISKCCRGILKTCGKMHWEYIE